MCWEIQRILYLIEQRNLDFFFKERKFTWTTHLSTEWVFVNLSVACVQVKVNNYIANVDNVNLYPLTKNMPPPPPPNTQSCMRSQKEMRKSVVVKPLFC